ncbi:MAG: tetratricopeptide repeat protein [Alphaproteobacteria bacterium]|nr:tetratricopeptide repeat protein [Alphaproteobacteria bacterium]MBT4083758.1 tetratricopeptide repeat protein [Alphaproteobacteria bacterium]MBT4545280.1 tetratricopeptide repeat protein [Alphaproteobacteria bacterium]MBT6385162.1 tetratricopeptide repeat protein [Alphaproteobacteria bacterium]MBT7744668.1 tetratricopeptide repeat protein [Alphaproteobacteria bacterium]
MSDQPMSDAPGGNSDAATGSETAMQAALDHHRQGDLVGAKTAYEAILEAEPDNAQAWQMLGLVAHQTGDAATALEKLGHAAALRPDNPDIHVNIAEVLRSEGNAEEAIAAYRRAIAIDPNAQEALTNLGLLALENQYIGEGVEALRRSAILQPDNPAVQTNLGLALREVGDFDNCLVAFARALIIAPEQIAFRQHFLDTLDGGPFIKVPDGIRRLLEDALLTEGLHHQSLVPACVAVLKREEIFQGLLSLAQDPYLNGLSAALEGGQFDTFFTDFLVRGLMTRTVVADPDFETILTALRRLVLQEGVPPQASVPMVQRHPQFVTALAMQAYATGYAWPMVPKEGTLSGILVRDTVKLLAGLDDQADIDASAWSGLMVSSCYRSMSTLVAAEKLLSGDVAGMPSFIVNLIRQQVAEPALEKEMATSIETLSGQPAPVPDNLLAGEQAVLPSPVWSTLPARQEMTLGDIMRSQIPGVDIPRFAEGPINAMVVGCRTGEAAIDLAIQHPESRIMGVDGNSANVAYAWRQAMQRGIGNTRFVVGDIADLATHDQKYHLIGAPDAVSQSADALKSLYILSGLLEDDGVLKIGMYSSSGRAAVKAAREAVAESGLKNDEEGLLAARKLIRELDTGHAARDIMTANAFYTREGCRELLFAEQESLFTVPALAATLAQAGLTFLGFQISDPVLVGHYLELFPDAQNLSDLDKWQKVESEYPDAFSSPESYGTYRLWCQKKQA